MVRRSASIVIFLWIAGVGAAPTDLENGQRAFRVKDWPAAERYFAQALRATPNNPAAHKWIGMTYAAQEKFPLAEAPFRRACELASKDPDVCYYYGRTLYVLGKFDASLAAYQRSAAESGNSPRLLLGLALVHEKLNHFEEAERYYRAAVAAGDRNAAADFERFKKQPRVAAGIGGIRFETRELPFTLRNGAVGKRHLPETMLGGIAAIDFDSDGLTDLFFANGATMPDLEKSGPEFQNTLLRNLGGGRFENVTARAGLSGLGYSMGAAAADYDNDGRPDLLVTGVKAARLYRNRGDGSFEDVTTRAGLEAATGWTVSAAWLDYDRDGQLDLFIARYVQWDPATEPFCGLGTIRQYCHPKFYQPLDHLLFRNLGNGKFEDVSVAVGIAGHPGKGMGVAVGDIDQDGFPDIFIANDAVPNQLFRNVRGRRFEEQAVAANVALTENGQAASSMGAEFKDWNNDGHDDLTVTALTNETFPTFLGAGAGRFEDVTLSSGIAKASLPWTGWSLATIDLDNDGWKDIVTANGHVMDNAEASSGRKSRQPCQVYRNLLGRTFSGAEVTAAAFHRGLAWADFDGDGLLDVAISRINEPALLLLNRTSNPGHWIAFRLRGRTSNRDGIGARIRVDTAEGSQWNRIETSNGYASSSIPFAYFGLGAIPNINRVLIQWPSGNEQSLAGLAPDRIHLLIEP